MTPQEMDVETLKTRIAVLEGLLAILLEERNQMARDLRCPTMSLEALFQLVPLRVRGEGGA